MAKAGKRGLMKFVNTWPRSQEITGLAPAVAYKNAGADGKTRKSDFDALNGKVN